MNAKGNRIRGSIFSLQTFTACAGTPADITHE
jgi:hypothetical protein